MAHLQGTNMTEVFAWGYTAWGTRLASGEYEVSGYVDGLHVTLVAADVARAKREFCRTARGAWFRRVVCRIRPPAPKSYADTFCGRPRD